ncbi:MAG: 4Fe-4S dicluster domain-containing protein [Desulfobacterium sp.]
MTKILYANPELCTGCNRCTYICSALKEGQFIPSKSKIKINNFPIHGFSVPSICFQCAKPECLKVCPEKAISKGEDGVVSINMDLCTTCGECAKACSYGMIELDAESKPSKCDYCGGDPACVKECYSGALVYKEMDKVLLKQRSLQMKQKSNFEHPWEKRLDLGKNIMAYVRG